MLRRVRTLAVLEFVNIALIAWVLVGVLRMPVTAANLAGLALVLVVLAEGGAYWWVKSVQLAAGAAAPAGMGVFRVLDRVNVVVLAGGAAVVGAGAVESGGGAGVWPGAALWVFAVLEQVNYFHVQLSHDTRADLSRLVRSRRLRRSHLRRDLDRGRAA
ncbi:hypothetical protein CLV63_104171 [Murinocardiopsis flavida]|uniref:Uncharacterized protein n=1 Tax=Murinocardiopsis flavida TaxID=645275 RepID=A0A2P8DP02_9ACTN|nr:hypothetical protein CLV63_104171 [Murinocardiopsis flavida]